MASRSKKITLAFAVIIAIAAVWVAYKVSSPELIKTNDGKYAIAVLPFESASATKANSWVSDGMTEFISLRLQPNPQFLVISGSSVEQFKGSESSVSDIADKLGVSYLIQGSILHKDNSILVTVALIDELNQIHWTDDYEVSIDEIINVQASIANNIVQELQVLLSPEKSELLALNPTNKVDAYKLFIQGKELARTRKTENFPKALELYQQAVLIDPSFAEAFAEIGHMHYFMHRDNLMSQDEAYHKIKYYSNKAISLNPNVSRAYTVRSLGMLISGKMKDSLYVENFRKAIEINPNDAIAYLQLADYYTSRYYYKRGVDILKEGVRIDPMSPLINKIYCRYLARALKVKEASEHYQKIKFFLNAKDQMEIQTELVFAEAEQHLLIDDWESAEKVILAAENDLKDSDHYYGKLSHYYDVIMNNDSLHYVYAKRAFDLDTTKAFSASIYSEAVTEFRQMEEAKAFFESETFGRLVPKNLHEQFWATYHYYDGNYEVNIEQIEENAGLLTRNDLRLLTYAQVNNREKVYKIYNTNKVTSSQKARVSAILKDRDSVYYYLGKNDIDMRFVNSKKEFDPFRKEQRFKSHLKKHKIPSFE